MRGVIVDGPRLRSARVQRGLTQEQLATSADVDVKTVRKAERSGRLDVATLVRLATPLEVGVESVMQDGHHEATHSDLQAIAFRWLAAWDARDGDALMDLFHEDAVMHLPGAPLVPFGGTHRGRDAIRRANDLAWATARTTPEPTKNYSVIAGEDVVILQGYKGIQLPDGQVVRLWGYHLIRVDRGLIVDFRAEYDTLRFAEIVGLLPMTRPAETSR